MRSLQRFGIAAVLMGTVVLAAPAIAADAACDAVRAELAPLEVIEPCTALLAAALPAAERAQVLFVRAGAFHRSFQYQRALADYTAALALAPGDEEILLGRSDIYLRLGDSEHYATDVQRAWDLRPKSAHVMRAVATAMFNFGERERARELYTEALRVDPEEPYALLLRSQQYQSEQKFKEAIADADKLVRVTEDRRLGYLDSFALTDFHVAALLQRANLFELSGQSARARQDYDAAVARGPCAAALTQRAFFYETSTGNREAALRDLMQATALEPQNARAQYALGMVFTRMHRWDEAFAAFNDAVTARPTYAQALEMRARMHRHFGRFDEAVRDFEAALQADPELIGRAMPPLRRAGYWRSDADPREVTPAFADALRACMADVTCN